MIGRWGLRGGLCFRFLEIHDPGVIEHGAAAFGCCFKFLDNGFDVVDADLHAGFPSGTQSQRLWSVAGWNFD